MTSTGIVCEIKKNEDLNMWTLTIKRNSKELIIATKKTKQAVIKRAFKLHAAKRVGAILFPNGLMIL